MTGDVIKSFLVGLGFSVDDGSLAKFNKSIASATLRVTALYGSINLASAGIVKGLSSISEGFEQMGYEYRIIAPAINKALQLRRELLKAYAAAGINIVKVVQNSVKLNLSLAKTKFAFEAIYKSVASRFFETLTKQSDLFRQKIYANMPKIMDVLERMIKFIFKALDATTALGIRLWSILTRVYDFFKQLDEATNGWSTAILGVIAAWKILNLSFLATPFGMIITGLVAILALFDDFKTWQEGGESLFDWSSFVPVINAVSDALHAAWEQLKSLGVVLGDIGASIVLLFQGDFKGAFDTLKQTFKDIGVYLDHMWEATKGIISSIAELGSWAGKLFSGANILSNFSSLGGIPQVAPIGSNVQNSQSNQHVQQQTNINVMGSADAQSVGKTVASEQGKVNFDMVRNLKGATR